VAQQLIHLQQEKMVPGVGVELPPPIENAQVIDFMQVSGRAGASVAPAGATVRGLGIFR